MRKQQAPENWPDVFLAEYAKAGIVTTAARKARVTRANVYARRESHPEFAQAMDAAREEATDLLEAEALRRAAKGTLKPVFYKGQQCGSIREYSDALMALLLKANRPEKYKERTEQQLSGSVTVKTMSLDDADEDELKRRLADAAAALLPPGSDALRET